MANAATHARTEVIDVDGAPMLVHAPGSGLAPLVSLPLDRDRDHGHDQLHPVVVTEHSMANGLLAVQWDLDGTITSIIDVARGR